MNGHAPKPYDVSAQYSDYVYEQCFGATGRSMNQRVVEAVKALVPKPGRILEFGAGTGRLTIPLAQAGYSVTAVDQSAGMVAQLEEKLAVLAPDVQNRITLHRKCIERYRFRQERYKLVLCVFTVLNHLATRTSVRAFAQMAYRRLEPGGYLLVGLGTEPVLVPGTLNANPAVFTFRSPQGRLYRRLVLELRQLNHYRRDDSCKGAFHGDRFEYHEVFDWWIWKPEEVTTIFLKEGFEEIRSSGIPSRMDADCFLFMRPDPRREEDDSVKDLLCGCGDDAGNDSISEQANGHPAAPEGPNAEGHEPLPTLSALSLTVAAFAAFLAPNRLFPERTVKLT